MLPPLTLQQLEDTYLFPLLNATPEAFPRQRDALEQTQCAAINMLRVWFYPCATPQALQHALALTLAAPRLRRTWEAMRKLGFATPLDTPAPFLRAA